MVAARAEAARNWETVRALATDSRLAALLADGRGLGLLKRLAPQLAAAARIWRFGANDYRAALGGNADATRALVGAIVGARWDGALTEAMPAYDRAIDEEALAHSLMPDLDIRLKRALPETSSVLP